MHLKKNLLLLSLIVTLGACGSDSDIKLSDTSDGGNTTQPTPNTETDTDTGDGDGDGDGDGNGDGDGDGNGDGDGDGKDTEEKPIDQRIIGVWKSQCNDGVALSVVFGAGGLIFNKELHSTKTCLDVDPDVERFVGSYTLSEAEIAPEGLEYSIFDALGTDGSSSLLLSRERRIIDRVHERDDILFLGDNVTICKPALIPLWKWRRCTSSESLDLDLPFTRVDLSEEEEKLLRSSSGNEIIAKCEKKGGVLSNFVAVPADFTVDVVEAGIEATSGVISGVGNILRGDLLGATSDFLNIPIGIAANVVETGTDLARGVIHTGVGTIVTGLSFILERGRIDTDNELGIEELVPMSAAAIAAAQAAQAAQAAE